MYLLSSKSVFLPSTGQALKQVANRHFGRIAAAPTVLIFHGILLNCILKSEKLQLRLFSEVVVA